MNAVEIMMEEHKYISRMLKVVRSICYKIYEEKKINFEDFKDVLYFIRIYADGLHHKKEEIMLFNKMVENLGAVAEKTINYGMLVEHDMGRLYVKDLDEALNEYKSGNEAAVIDIIANAVSYTNLLERHIDKEDNVIYKFGQKNLSSEILNEINEQCVIFEEENKVLRDGCLDILKRLEKKYL